MMRRALKRLRASQPFNYLATTACRAACAPLGGAPEVFVRRLPRTGSAESRLPNGRTLRLWSRGDDQVANVVFWRGWAGYEPETTPLFYELACNAQVVLDVGAHVGFYSLLAAHANPSARVVGFEPLPAAAERFRRNVAENRLSNVELLECAVGDEPGAATLYNDSQTGEGIPTSSGLSAEFFQSPYFVEHGVRPGAQVEVRTLDEAARSLKLGRVDLIKIDTETTEPAVLRGARAVLASDRPALVFEVLPGHGTAPEIEELLAPLGYRFYLLGDKGPEPREHIADHPAFWNYLAKAVDSSQ